MNIPYNFPVMEKAKKEREKLWDIYHLKDQKQDNRFPWEKEEDDPWGNNYQE